MDVREHVICMASVLIRKNEELFRILAARKLEREQKYRRSRGLWGEREKLLNFAVKFKKIHQVKNFHGNVLKTRFSFGLSFCLGGGTHEFK